MITSDILDIPTDAWQVWIQLAGLVFIVSAAIVGLVQLRDVKRSNRFGVLSHFNQRRSEFEPVIAEIINGFPVCQEPADFAQHEDRWASQARMLVGELNLWCQYVEEGLFRPRLFMSVYHSQMIRIAFLLKPFMDWEQERLGTRYGRRVLRIAARAKVYHCLNPLHRDNRILLGRDSPDIVVFDPQGDPELSKLSSLAKFRALLRLALGRF